MIQSSALATQARPQKERKPKKCRICKNPFHPVTSLHVVCSGPCVLRLAELKQQKESRKLSAEIRKDTREKLKALETLPMLKKRAQAAFNAFIRTRDANLPCICCGKNSDKQYLTGSNWDCGHYRSTGSAPHLRFNEDNAHRQLTVCNRHGAGRAVDYRIGLIARIGLARVEALESNNTARNYTREELIALAVEYRRRTREMLK